MTTKATKSNGKTATKKAVVKERVENIEMNKFQAKKLEDAITNRQLAQQQLVMMNNAEQDITQLITNAHGIDNDKVLKVNINGNVLAVTMIPEEETKDD